MVKTIPVKRESSSLSKAFFSLKTLYLVHAELNRAIEQKRLLRTKLRQMAKQVSLRTVSEQQATID
jgi:hypothetical protein